MKNWFSYPKTNKIQKNDSIKSTVKEFWKKSFIFFFKKKILKRKIEKVYKNKIKIKHLLIKNFIKYLLYNGTTT